MSVDSQFKKIGTIIHVFPEDDGYVVQTSQKQPGRPRIIADEYFADDDTEAMAIGSAKRKEYPEASFWFNPKGERRVF